MTSAINTKILIAILAALAGLAATAGVMLKNQADALALQKRQAAAQLAVYKHDQQVADAQEKARKDYEAAVAKRNAQGSAPGHESHTWQTYLP
ncbi:hypothetical protein [Acidipila sp. EB88]|uniref:hypothetical protein n=1 Tax=Acidipila sp. EB88 TaxID=2305226 RepID=UPI000F5E8991|nr:hypothetical protein [Acidipila sp. EB88]RRA50452.1 hypothetical protein D1Y84_00110 [Acidipila sp. EB88]